MRLNVNGLTALLKNSGIIPTVCLKTEEEVNTLMRALEKTPIRCVEIMLRHPFSPSAIAYIKRNFPEFIVGAGTVVSDETLKCAIKSGADFCVSPGFDEKLIKKAQRKGIPFLAGCATPSEILKAMKLNLTTLKYFPAEASGGVSALKLYESAFSGISFVVTGGINLENYLKYLKCENVIACGGGFMIPKDMLASGDSHGIADVILKCISEIEGVQR